MYIGKIGADLLPKFYHANTNIPHEPQKTENGYVWTWGNMFDCAVDIVYTLDKDCYIGSIEAKISGAAEVCVLIDGIKAEAKDASKPIYVNLCGKEIIIRLRGNFKDIRFFGAEFFGFRLDDDEPFILPTPKKLDYNGNRVKIGSLSASDVDGKYAVEFLKDSLVERYEAISRKNGISLCFEISEKYENERYSITVSEDQGKVIAGSRLALLWGACRVIDLWDDGTLPIISIDDHPDVPMRGFHMGLPRADKKDFVKKLARYVLLPFGYNHVILEFNGDMRYDRHPEITEKWIESEKLYQAGKGERVMHADIGAEGTALEKSDVRELIEIFDGYGIEVIPEIQTLAHIEYITNAYPEFAELGKYIKNNGKDRLAGIPHTHLPEHCYCPLSRDCMAIVHDIIDEVVEVVKPKRYVHIGHDEAYHLGLCPECRAKGAPTVYAEHVKHLYDYLAKKGLGTMLWSDMFHTDMYYTGERFDFVKRELPKDLLLLDFTWYFHLDKDIEDSLLPEGYKIMMGNLYSSHYPRFASRIKKDGMIGGEVSTWTAVSEEKFASNGKFFDLPYTAEMLWNAYSYDERNRASYTTLIGQIIIPEMRDLMHEKYDLYLASDIDSTELIGNFEGSADKVPDELSYLGLTEPKGVLTVGEKFNRLIFEHATLCPAPRICWQELYHVGDYTVHYEDGETVSVPVRSAGGILHINSHYGLPMPDNYYRHQGYVGTWFADPTYEYRTAEGKPILLLGQVWDNPHPDKTIASISYIPDEKDYAILVSAGVLGIKK